MSSAAETGSQESSRHGAASRLEPANGRGDDGPATGRPAIACSGCRRPGIMRLCKLSHVRIKNHLIDLTCATVTAISSSSPFASVVLNEAILTINKCDSWSSQDLRCLAFGSVDELYLDRMLDRSLFLVGLY